MNCSTPKTYYECHITMAPSKGHVRDAVRYIVEALGWKFSSIEGDIVLGDGIKWYATKHFNSRKLGNDEVITQLHLTANYLKHTIEVVRRKVELVIYDDRSDKVRPCAGGCVECHLDDLKG